MSIESLPRIHAKQPIGRLQKPVALRLAAALAEAAPQASDPAPETLLASGFHELLAASPGHETVTTALVFTLALKAAGGVGKTLCYCTLTGETQERGALYGAGLAGLGIDPARLLMVTAAKEKDLLWTLEEAAASGAFGAIIGALGRKETLYGFAESRRLKLRAAAKGTPLYLIRHWSAGGSTAAQGRWRVSTRPSRSDGRHGKDQLLGPARLELRLERLGGFPPQQWEMEFDATRGFHLAPLMEDGPDRGAGKGRHQAA
jgi:protein ImuA